MADDRGAVLFFAADAETRRAPRRVQLEREYRWEIWRPGIFKAVPKTFGSHYYAWALFHYTRVFRNRDYSVCLVYRGPEVIHRAVVTPPYFRFPFMKKGDLQIGDVWTQESHRGKGIAVFAIQAIMDSNQRKDRKFWYLVENTNLPSMRTAEKAGLVRVGIGFKKKRLGVNLLARYVLSEGGGDRSGVPESTVSPSAPHESAPDNGSDTERLP